MLIVVYSVWHASNLTTIPTTSSFQEKKSGWSLFWRESPFLVGNRKEQEEPEEPEKEFLLGGVRNKGISKGIPSKKEGT